MRKLKPPSPKQIGGELLDRDYERTMERPLHMMKEAGGATIGIDGASNVMSNAICNEIAHTPIPFFVEYNRVDLKIETAENVTKMLLTFCLDLSLQLYIGVTLSFRTRATK